MKIVTVSFRDDDEFLYKALKKEQERLSQERKEPHFSFSSLMREISLKHLKLEKKK